MAVLDALRLLGLCCHVSCACSARGRRCAGKYMVSRPYVTHQWTRSLHIDLTIIIYSQNPRGPRQLHPLDFQCVANQHPYLSCLSSSQATVVGRGLCAVGCAAVAVVPLRGLPLADGPRHAWLCPHQRRHEPRPL